MQFDTVSRGVSAEEPITLSTAWRGSANIIPEPMLYILL
jgi:hypothetical protein